MAVDTLTSTNDYIPTPGDFPESKKRVIFDASDVDSWVTHLTPDQLREAIHNAAIQQGVARCFGEDYGIVYWEDLGKACELALNIQKSMQPKRRVSKGKLSIQAIKETNDIVDIISRYTTLRGRDTRYYGYCPFHQDHTPSLSVDTKKQLWHCFSCEQGGDIIDFIKLAENLDTRGAINFLGNNLNG